MKKIILLFTLLLMSLSSISFASSTQFNQPLVGMQIQELVALVLLSLKDTIVSHMIVLRLVEEQKR